MRKFMNDDAREKEEEIKFFGKLATEFKEEFDEYFAREN